MTKKVWFGLVLGLVALLLVGVAVSGCSQVQEAINKLKDPGLITSGEATTISGSAKYSGGTVDVNLNAILSSGEALTLAAGKFGIFVGKSGTATSEWESVDFTVPSESKPMNMVFIMDNTGSMASRIRSVKDSIIAFTQSLEAAGVAAKFGVVSFGDTPSEQSYLGLAVTAEAVRAWLDALSGVGGGDTPENPLDAIMYANDNFTWEAGAQKVFVVITDNPFHQLGDSSGYTVRDYTSAEAALLGNATVYAVSPKMITAGYWFDTPTEDPGTGDPRWLADGYGWFTGVTTMDYGVTKPKVGTGGKWTELADSGVIDLNALGISTIVSKGYAFRFTYTFSAGTWYIHVLVDTNNDGIYDSDLVITITVASGASVASSSIVGLQPIKETAVKASSARN